MGFSSDRLSHSYITDDAFANTIAMAVVCGNRSGERPCMKCTHCNKASRHIHPDITEINEAFIADLDKSLGKTRVRLDVNVDVVRYIKKDVFIVPNDSMQKVYIVRNADTMNTSAQNAFLRILEEPPAHAVFILCTEKTPTLLPTVRSRCVELKHGLSPLQKVDSHEADSQSSADETDHDELKKFSNDFIEALKGDNVKLMECMFHIDKLDRQALQSFLSITRENVVYSLRENMGQGIGNNNFSKKLFKAEDAILKAGEMLDLNVSAGNIAGYLFASLL